jgi:hypothetical protein
MMATMKKSQPFKQDPTRYYLLIEDTAKNSAFWLRHSEDQDEENDGYYAEQIDMPVYFEVVEKDQVTVKLTEELIKLGFAVASYRELARETILLYSYIDETPGTQQDDVCLHVRADLANELRPGLINVPLSALMEKTSEFLVNDRVVRLGINRLLSERAH